MLSLEGKNCIVTGGASGLGLEIVDQLVAEKARPIIFDLDENRLAALAGRGELRAYCCDVTDERQVEETVKAIVGEFGSIDVLVNNVGVLFSAPLISLSPSGLKLHSSQMWEKVISTNLSSAFYVSKHVVQAMLKKRTKGVIVNISSISARGNAGQSAYAAAKAGLDALTKVWAKELPSIGIRCFGVAPGFCDTESTHLAVNEKVLQDTLSRVPLRRLGQAQEIAAFVIAGIKNEFLNGKILEVDGGLVI